MSTVGNWRGPNIVKDGLALYLDVGNPNSFYSPTAGVIWKDVSGNSNNGTLTNGPTFNSDNGGSIVFDGTNDYIITADNQTPTLNITSQITIESWVRTTAVANISHTDGIVSKGLSSDNNSGVYELCLYPTSNINYPFFRMRIGSSTVTNYPTNIPINLNNVYQIVGTYNGNIMRVFVNGIESGTGVAASGDIQSNTQQLTIGVRYLNRSGGNDSFFTGNMYNIKIYNKELTPTEILQNYNATKGRFGL